MEEVEIIDESVLVVPDDKKHTFDEQMAIECVKKIKNPFRMLTVEMVMKDLNICRSIAYKLFKSEDFPAFGLPIIAVLIPSLKIFPFSKELLKFSN